MRRYQNKDGTLTAAGRSRYVGSNAEGTDEKSQKRVGLSDKQKRALKIGAALAVAALGTYGGYRLAKSGKLEPFVAAGKQKAAELMEEAGKERSSTPKTHAHSDYTRAHEKKSVRVPVSYTHLDVYKRQVLDMMQVYEDLDNFVQQNQYDVRSSHPESPS